MQSSEEEKKKKEEEERKKQAAKPQPQNVNETSVAVTGSSNAEQQNSLPPQPGAADESVALTDSVGVKPLEDGEVFNIALLLDPESITQISADIKKIIDKVEQDALILIEDLIKSLHKELGSKLPEGIANFLKNITSSNALNIEEIQKQLMTSMQASGVSEKVKGKIQSLVDKALDKIKDIKKHGEEKVDKILTKKQTELKAGVNEDIKHALASVKPEDLNSEKTKKEVQEILKKYGIKADTVQNITRTSDGIRIQIAITPTPEQNKLTQLGKALMSPDRVGKMEAAEAKRQAVAAMSSPEEGVNVVGNKIDSNRGKSGFAAKEVAKRESNSKSSPLRS